MYLIVEFKKMQEKMQADKGLSARELNKLRLAFITEHGLCEETLQEIIMFAKDKGALSEMMAVNLTKKYLYEPPMLDDIKARFIKREICELAKKYDSATVNNMIADVLYEDVNGIKYARGVGNIIESLRKLNNL